MDKKEYFKLFACCIPVEGAKRSLLCDVQRSICTFIEPSLFQLLKLLDEYSIEEIKNHFGDQGAKQIDSFFKFLVEEEWGHFTTDPECFPNIDLQWKHPSSITNAIVDINDLLAVENHYYSETLKQILDIGCNALQLRVYRSLSIEKLARLLEITLSSTLQSVELLIPYEDKLTGEHLLESLINSNLRITSIIVSSSPSKKLLNYRGTTILFVEDRIDSQKHCGIISEYFFSLNMSMFTESHHHNSCLNRKIAIDAEGNIKNCPSMPQSFGNIKDTTLAEALAHPDFKKYWNITKDQVKVCQDCEFRYICTDCRAYLEDPQDDYSKPLKCGYDPYTGQWAEWSTHPLKQRAIDYYGMREIL